MASASGIEQAATSGDAPHKSRGVGGGPRLAIVGVVSPDPELLPLRAARLIAEADSIVFDESVAAAVLDLAPARARRAPISRALGTAEVERILLSELRAAKAVVLLRGEEPLLAGDTAEELEFLRRRGFEPVLVPAARGE